MRKRIKALAFSFRAHLASKFLMWGTRLLPEGAYKNMMLHAFYSVNADLLQATGKNQMAKELRQAIAPMRVGGRQGERARKRKRL